MRILVIGKNGQVGQSIQNLVNKTSNSNLSDYGFVFVGFIFLILFNFYLIKNDDTI